MLGRYRCDQMVGFWRHVLHTVQMVLSLTISLPHSLRHQVIGLISPHLAFRVILLIEK